MGYSGVPKGEENNHPLRKSWDVLFLLIDKYIL